MVNPCAVCGAPTALYCEDCGKFVCIKHSHPITMNTLRRRCKACWQKAMKAVAR